MGLVWFRYSVDRAVTKDETDDLRVSKNRLQGQLAHVIARWQKELDKGFDDWYAEEIAAHGDALIRCWLEFSQTADAVWRGNLPQDSFPQLNYAVRLVASLFCSA